MIEKVHYLQKDIRNVTKNYYDILISSLLDNGVKICSVSELKLFTKIIASRDDYFLVTGMATFLLIYLKGFRNFIFWFQGVAPEEVYMITNSKWKKYGMALIERFALKHCEYKIGVSKYQFNHFENKYKLRLDWNKIFIMPCFNSEFSPEVFNKKGKYENDIFCYAGGMQVWQGFDEILKMFAEIEKHSDKVFLKILSKDIDTARIKIMQYNIQHFSIKSVPQESVSNELANCKYGFILREDNIINNVATPTKLATYIGNGIIPIFTSTIYFYRDLAQKYKYLYCIDSSTDVDTVNSLLENSIEPNNLRLEYAKLFDDVFSKRSYISRLKVFFAQ